MATKRTDLELDEFRLDDDLDFDRYGANVDSMINPEAKVKKSRTPVQDVVSGTIEGARSRFQDPAFLARVSKDSLPDSYGTIFEAANQAAGTASSLYDEAVKELKPQLGRIAKKVDKLVPDDSRFKKFSKAFVQKTADDDEIYRGADRTAFEEQSITNAIGSIFQQQQAAEEKSTIRENAQEQIKEQIEQKRFRSNFGLLSTIADSNLRMSNYTEKVTQAYQKKSLELQFRSYFAQTELLDTTKRFFQVFKYQNEAIAKNTGLPEFVKINNSERFKDLARTKFFDNIQNSLFGADSAIGKGLQRMKKDAMDYIRGIKEGMETAGMGLDAVDELQELNRSLMEMGEEPITAARLGGNQIGEYLTNKFGEKAAELLKPLASRNKGISDFGNKVGNTLLNVPGAIRDYRDSDKYRENMEKEGLQGTVFRGLDKLADYFTDRGADFNLTDEADLRTLNQASVFDNRTKKTIEDIIPGYLARILREISSMRTGDDAAPLTIFDHTNGKFVDQKTGTASLKSVLASKVKASSFNYRLDNAVNSLTEDEEVNDEQKELIKMFLAKISKMENVSYKPENLTRTRAFADLDEDTGELLKKLLDKKVSQSEDPLKGQYDLTKSIVAARDATPDLRPELEMLVKAGYADLLEKEGFIKRGVKGNIIIDEDKYHEFVQQEGIAKSDVNAKRNIEPVDKREALKSASKRRNSMRRAKSDIDAKESISKFSPSAALRGIKNTKIYKWFYKTGQGDQEPHVGPMAHDVKRNTGEEAAPDGKSIDLVSLNGQNMAAIQALNDKQEKLSGSDSSKGVLTNIRSDTAKIVKILSQWQKTKRKSQGTAESTASFDDEVITGEEYGDIGKRAFKDAKLFGKKVVKDTVKSGKGVFNFIKDKGVLPASAKMEEMYEKYKEPVKEKLGQIYEAGTRHAMNALDQGKNLVLNILPKYFEKTREFGLKVTNWVREQINSAKDIYVKGKENPVLRATLLKAGYYRDKVSGKVLRTMDDLKDIKGDIIGPAGEVILSIEEAAEGLYDQHGEKIKSTFQKVMATGVGILKEGYARAKAFWSEVGEKGAPVLGKIKDKVSGMFSRGKDKLSETLGGMNLSGGFAFGNDKVHSVLVEIRDFLIEGKKPGQMSGHPPAAEGSSTEETVIEKSSEPQAAQAATEPQYRASGNTVDQIMGAGGKLLGKVGGIKGLGQKAMGFAGDIAGKVGAEKGIKGKTGAFFGGLRDKLRGGASSIVDKIKNKDDGLIGPRPEMVGPMRPEKTTYAQKAKQALGGIRDDVKGAKGIKGKTKAFGKGIRGTILGGLGSIFSGNKEGDQAQENPSQEAPKAAIGQAQPSYAEQAQAAGQETVVTKKKGDPSKATFNDRDGSGQRDGAWQERLEEQEKRRKESRKEMVQADKNSKYRSDENIIDTMINKASGIFSSITGAIGTVMSGASGLIGGAASMLGLAGGGGILGKIAGLATAPFKLAGKGMGLVGKGLGAIGSPIAKGVGAVAKTGIGSKIGTVFRAARGISLGLGLASGGALSAVAGVAGTAITAIGAVLTSPVVLGAAAVAAVGFGAYKLYQRITRNDVDTLQSIRMSQYGLTDSNNNYYHKLLQLEEYMQDNVGYEKGKAYILEKRVDKAELLNIFEIDPQDSEMGNRFARWFAGRFKPFYLTSMTAIMSINNKLKLKDAGKKLTPEEKLKYVKLIAFENGPFGETASPFRELEELSNTKELTKKKIDAVIEQVKAEVKKKEDEANEPSFWEKTKKAATDVARGAVTGVAGKAAADKLLGAETPKPLPKTNMAPGGDKATPQKAAAAAAAAAGAAGAPTGGEGEDAGQKPKETAGSMVGSVTAGGRSKVNNLKEAPGPVRDGSTGMQYIKAGPNVDVEGLNPAVLKNLKAMAQEYGETTGKSISLNDAKRSTAMQEALWRKDPSKAAPPGKSLHEFGFALDMNTPVANELDEMGLMRKYGFSRPVGGETWHVEPVGIGLAIDKSKQDPSFAESVVHAGVMKGGGGFGSDPSIKKGDPRFGRRNVDTVMAVMKGEGVTQAKAPASNKDAIQAKLTETKPGSSTAKAQTDKGTVTASTGTTSASVSANTGATASAGGVIASAGPSGATATLPVKKAANDGTVKIPGINVASAESEKYSKNDAMQEVEMPPKNDKKSDDKFDNIDPRNRKEVVTAIKEISKQQNADPEMATAFAAKESSLNPTAKASTSSAAGLFQFTRATWNEQMGKHARKYDIDPNTPPTDIEASTLLANEYIKSNIRLLKGVKSDPNLTDVYLAHFLGAGGARKFLKADPNEIAANILPDAAKANKSIFYANGRPLTVSEVYSKLDSGLANTAKSFGISLPKGNSLTPRQETSQQKTMASQADSTSESTQRESTKTTATATSAPAQKLFASSETGRAVTSVNEPAAPPAPKQASLFRPQGANVVEAPQPKQQVDLNSQALSQMTSVLDQQLSVQNQMLTALNLIAKNLSPEQFADLLKQVSPNPNTAPPPNVGRQTQGNRITEVGSQIDLRRKSA